ncbi:MAG TPA: 3-phosphoserine/phosphohydroxythreonine transaminase [Spirochaetota bacterium]|nr:3-phosphoserine/phosphohydroxythreonine transaminase [Spirochaetota bacterium]HPU87986.1 3-phosphoserine/phosphohydroxythreonine transaminase [Spirochaetota bacterium]
MARIYNFSSGPSMLPLPALEEAAQKLVDFEGSGMSLVEMSHRGKVYERVHNETIALFREILTVPNEFQVLFLQGGATLQFAMIPMAFLRAGDAADFILTGTWAKKAHEDASLVGRANIIWDGKTSKYTRMPQQKELSFTSGARYVHLCSNETIGGVQWASYPDTAGVPIVADMSSDILSRQFPWNNIGLVFAGTQKNLAPAGMAIVVIRKDFIAAARKDLPAYLRYDLHAENNSLYNTPPTFTVWATNLTLKWIKSMGGLEALERLNREKATLLYDLIDASGGYYKNPVEKASRSLMNVVWLLDDDGLEDDFFKEAERQGLSGLKGHRSVGGCRASIYNAMPMEGVRALADFMKEFMKKHG